MNSFTALAWLAVTCVLAVAGGAIGQASPTQPLVHGNTEFALDLYARLAQEKGNLFFSPYSISSALAMTYDGARGNTAAEMQKVLHFPFGRQALNPAFADLIHQLQD